MAVATALANIKNEYMEDVNNKMLELLLSGEYYDCTVKVGNNSNPPQFFKCHRVILSLASDVFFNSFKDAKIHKDKPITCFETFSSGIVVAALRFVYGCDTKTQNNDLEFNVELIKFTSQWNMLKLREITAWNCLNLFDLPVDDLLWLHLLFTFYKDMANEKERTMQLISQRGGEVLKSMHEACEEKSSFENLEDTIQAIFKETYINIGSEKDFLDALTRWGEAQVGGANEMSTAIIRVKVSELLKMVRFKAFTARDFAQLFMDDSSILTPQEKMSIYSFVHTQQGPLLESLIGLDLNSGWRCRFHPDTKIVLLTSNEVKDDNQNSQWLIPERNTYLLSVGVDASKYLKVNKKFYIKIGIGVKSEDDGTVATFDSSFFSGSDNMEQKNKMIRLTMPYLLEKKIIYTVYVTESNQPTERLMECELGSALNVAFPGIQTDWILTSGGTGEIIAYEFGRPISPS